MIGDLTSAPRMLNHIGHLVEVALGQRLVVDAPGGDESGVRRDADGQARTRMADRTKSGVGAGLVGIRVIGLRLAQEENRYTDRGELTGNQTIASHSGIGPQWKAGVALSPSTIGIEIGPAAAANLHGGRVSRKVSP